MDEAWRELDSEFAEKGGAEAIERAAQWLEEAGLVSVGKTDTEAGPVRHYAVTDAVEHSVRDQAAGALAERFLGALARLWETRLAREQARPTAHTVRTGIAASAYLRRLGRFGAAFETLERGVFAIAYRTGDTRHVLAHLELIASASGDRALVAALDATVEQLAEAQFRENRWPEALATIQVGLDQATRHALDSSRLAVWREKRLKLMFAMGQHQELLTELPLSLQVARDAMSVETSGNRSRIVRENMLHHGLGAAKALGKWKRALKFNSRIVSSLERRGASAKERARCSFAHYAALLELGDAEAAEKLLLECQPHFEGPQDKYMLAMVLGARGLVASRRGDAPGALKFKRSSLQTFYDVPGCPREKANAHQNYGNEMLRTEHDPGACCAHWLAAAVIFELLGNRNARAQSVENLARFIVDFGQVVPKTSNDLVASATRDGLKLGELLASLREEPRAVATAVADIVAESTELARRAGV